MLFEEYKEKTVFITGAASGIGQAQAEVFLKNGANVFALDINEEGLATLKKQYGSRFTYFIGSVSSGIEVEAAVQKTLSYFKQIDILVNTAGVLDGYKKTLETDEKLWDHIINTNLKGVFLVTNAVLPHMIAHTTARLGD